MVPDQSAPALDPEFEQILERHRRELQVHCYRMLGSLEDSEDLVQETFLRAWRNRDSFEGRSSHRAWLYKIATNACLDFLRSKPRRLLPSHLGPGADPPLPVAPPADFPWLQPYPDELLDGVAPSTEQPDQKLVARETIEIAFIAAVQVLPPKQRAAFILRDVLDWSAKETAALLEASVASVNSALQRARSTIKAELPEGGLDREPSPDQSAAESELLQRFVKAVEQGEPEALVELLREDARATMPPHPSWHDGREAIMTAVRQGWDPSGEHYPGKMRALPVRGANRQPAAAFYLQRPGESEYRFFALDVLRMENGKIAEITAFIAPEALEPDEKRLAPEMLKAFGLPETL